MAAARQPVGVPAPGERRDRPASAATRRRDRGRRRRAHPLGRRLGRPRRPLQLHGPGLPQRPRQHAAAVERQGDAGVQPRGLQRRRLRRGGPQPDLRREHLEGALPRGLDAAGQGAAAPAAVLLRGLLAARLHRPGAAARTSTSTSCPSGSSSSSTTPTRSSRCPSSCGSSSTSKGFDWDEAWAITQQCFAYTCHTLLPEALEVWPVELLGRLLPRHLEIIYRINDEFLDAVREAYPGDECAAAPDVDHRRVPGAVRMAYLATVAGSKVNGVAELHSQLLRDKVLPDFSEYWPDKFTNVTNGVTPAPVRAAGQPEPLRAHHRGDRPRLDHRPRPAVGARAVRRRRRRSGSGSARSRARTSRAWPSTC